MEDIQKSKIEFAMHEWIPIQVTTHTYLIGGEINFCEFSTQHSLNRKGAEIIATQVNSNKFPHFLLRVQDSSCNMHAQRALAVTLATNN